MLASAVVSVSGKHVKSIEYTMKAKKPLGDSINRVLVVTGVVNVGWCKTAGSDEWLREGDYLSVMRHRVMMSNYEDHYTYDINVVCYCKCACHLICVHDIVGAGSFTLKCGHF